MTKAAGYVCAALGSMLMLSGCTRWDDVARAEFVTAATCPAERVVVRERPDLQRGPDAPTPDYERALSILEQVPEAPPEIAADPERMRLWTQAHSNAWVAAHMRETFAGANASYAQFSIYEATGCGLQQFMTCGWHRPHRHRGPSDDCVLLEPSEHVAPRTPR